MSVFDHLGVHAFMINLFQLLPVADNVELHVFCDSSQKAFSSVAYLRVVTAKEVDVPLVLAKARVASTKPISIPRLELLYYSSDSTST